MVKEIENDKTKLEPVMIVGALDKARDEVDRLIANADSEIVLDFSECTFVSVEGIEWLEELVIRLESKSVQIRFENMPPAIYKVFKVSHIDCILKACGAPSSAIGPVC